MRKAVVGAAVVGAAAACAAAALVVRHRMKKSNKWARAMAILREFGEKCATPNAKLRQLVDVMTVEMHAGLASEGGSCLRNRNCLGCSCLHLSELKPSLQCSEQ